MSNPFDDMRAAQVEAETLMRAADKAATNMAFLLRGRLRHVPPWILADLKRELRDYNIHTTEWNK